MNHAGSTLTLNGGLDIQGKLVLPNNWRRKTIVSTMIVVQGELEMYYRGRITDRPAVTFDACRG